MSGRDAAPLPYALMLLAASATGCLNVGEVVPTQLPVLVGPVDHIGGGKTPLDTDHLADFHIENDSEVGLCVVTLYPSFYVIKPNAVLMPPLLYDGFAEVAGTAPLRSYVPRMGSLRVGAWESFVAGCYGQSMWWRGNGHLARVPQ